MDGFDKLANLPTIAKALNSTFETYAEHANGVKANREWCLDSMALFYDKFRNWCEHLNCMTELGPCQPWDREVFNNYKIFNATGSKLLSTAISVSDLSTLSKLQTETTVSSKVMQNISVYEVMKTIGFVQSKQCYDDLMCETPGLSYANFVFLGVTCLILALFGVIGNLFLLPAYNIGLNRSGATMYLSAIAVFDTAYLGLATLLFAWRFTTPDYQRQAERYAEFSAFLMPYGYPLMQMCELIVVWLVVALLVDRLVYMKAGFQCKPVAFYRMQAAKAVTAICAVTLAYSAVKWLAYTSRIFNEPMRLARVELTSIGNTTIYRNLMHNLLKVPLEMFIPYLSVGALVSVIVTKMSELHKSKWKAVASLCNDVVCASICNTSPDDRRRGNKRRGSVGESVAGDNEPVQQQPLLECPAVVNSDDLFEREMALIYACQPPVLDETRENANIVAAVCLGFLLLLCKLPKFLMYAIESENYIRHDPQLFLLINRFLNVMFAFCKPFVCIFVGAHLRRALMCFCVESAPGNNDQPKQDHASV